MEWLTLFSDTTLIPIGVVAIVIGGMSWMFHLDGVVSANTNLLNSQVSYLIETNKSLQEINQRLSRIEGKLDSN